MIQQCRDSAIQQIFRNTEIERCRDPESQRVRDSVIHRCRDPEILTKTRKIRDFKRKSDNNARKNKADDEKELQKSSDLANQISRIPVIP